MKDAWVLRLREESKEEGMTGDFYLGADGEEIDWLTKNLNEALIIKDKDAHIEYLKKHEQMIHEEFGKDAICNFGYTNITKHFEFVEVELETV